MIFGHYNDNNKRWSEQEAYTNLAIAIIEQAVLDIVNKPLEGQRGKKYTIADYHSAVTFLKSEECWYYLRHFQTDIDGEDILNHAERKRIENEENKRRFIQITKDTHRGKGRYRIPSVL